MLRLAQLALGLQVLLVVSGSAVRVTGSGLGCPTWPRCTGGSLTSTAALGGHGAIEFGNRLLAVGMELVGIALVVAVVRLRGPRSWRRLALVQAMVVPLQAVVGGLLVLSGLNPYVLILHFLASFPLIVAAAALVQRVRENDAPREPLARAELRWLTRGLVGASALVLKSSSADDVLEAIRRAATAPDAFTATGLAAALRRRNTLAAAKPILTPRETEVLMRLVDGDSVALVARQLFMSESTVKTHVGKVYEKLGAHNRASAIMAAVRLGFVKANVG